MAILLAVIGIFALNFPHDSNVRILKTNKRDAMRYEMPEDIIDQAQKFQADGTTYESTMLQSFSSFQIANTPLKNI